MSDTWHGLPYDHWLKMWEGSDWAGRVTRSLLAVARCKKAKAKYRVNAIQLLNEAITSELIPRDPAFPELFRDVMLEIVAGPPGKQSEPHKSAVFGARQVLHVVLQLKSMIDHETHVADARAQASGQEPTVEKLPS